MLAYRLGDAHGWRSAEYERDDDGGFDPGYGNWWPNVRGEAAA